MSEKMHYDKGTFKNSSRMGNRFDYVKYDDKAQWEQSNAKTACMNLESIINRIECTRAREEALKALELTYMWIGKGIRDDQITRNGCAELQEQRGNE